MKDCLEKKTTNLQDPTEVDKLLVSTGEGASRFSDVISRDVVLSVTSSRWPLFVTSRFREKLNRLDPEDAISLFQESLPAKPTSVCEVNNRPWRSESVRAHEETPTQPFERKNGILPYTHTQ